MLVKLDNEDEIFIETLHKYYSKDEIEKSSQHVFHLNSNFRSNKNQYIIKLKDNYQTSKDLIACKDIFKQIDCLIIKEYMFIHAFIIKIKNPEHLHILMKIPAIKSISIDTVVDFNLKFNRGGENPSSGNNYI